MTIVEETKLDAALFSEKVRLWARKESLLRQVSEELGEIPRAGLVGEEPPGNDAPFVAMQRLIWDRLQQFKAPAPVAPAIELSG